MGIELESIGTAISGASGVSKAGASLDAMFGPKMGPVGIGPENIVMDGPINSLEGFKPMGRIDLTLDLIGGLNNPNFDLGGEILFNSQPQALETVPAERETITSIEDFLAQARAKPQPGQVSLTEEKAVVEPVKQATYWFVDVPELQRVVKPTEAIMPQVVLPAWEPVVKPAVQPAVQPVVQPAMEHKTKNEITPAVSVQPAIEESETKEGTVTERLVTKQIDVIEEDIVKKKKKFVVDKPALAHRLEEAWQAIQKAKLEAEKLGYGQQIIGWILEKFLPLAHKGDMSQVVQPEGPDGTVAIIKENIKAKDKFESEKEVQAIILNNKPVSEEDDGEEVSYEEVRKVFKDRIVKPVNLAVELTKERITKKAA